MFYTIKRLSPKGRKAAKYFEKFFRYTKAVIKNFNIKIYLFDIKII